MSRPMLTKIAKIKYKEKVLNATKERQQVIYEGIPIRFSAAFLAETLQVRGSGMISLKWGNGKTYNQEYSNQQGSHSDSSEKSKSLQEEKLRELSSTTSSLQQLLK